MLRWFLIVMLALYGAWASWLVYWKPHAPAPLPPAISTTEKQPHNIFECPKCICAKDEHQVAPEDEEKTDEGNGS